MHKRWRIGSLGHGMSAPFFLVVKSGIINVQSQGATMSGLEVSCTRIFH
jgi:hypothetical protein